MILITLFYPFLINYSLIIVNFFQVSEDIHNYTCLHILLNTKKRFLLKEMKKCNKNLRNVKSDGPLF